MGVWELTLADTRLRKEPKHYRTAVPLIERWECSLRTRVPEGAATRVALLLLDRRPLFPNFRRKTSSRHRELASVELLRAVFGCAR